MIYVVTHKDSEILEDDLYKGLCVGKYQKDGMLSERDGVNITKYNDRINELTGLYWIWKNTTEDFVGMCHYRRFFQDGQQRAGADKIRENMEGADIILSENVYLPWIEQMSTSFDRKPVMVFTIPWYLWYENLLEHQIIELSEKVWFEFSSLQEMYKREQHKVARKVIILK